MLSNYGYKCLKRPVTKGVIAHSCSNGHVSLTIHQHAKDYYIDGLRYTHEEVLDYVGTLEADRLSQVEDDACARLQADIDRCFETAGCTTEPEE